MRIPALIAALAFAAPFSAHAACSSDATALAEKYGLTASLANDTASSSSAAADEKLAKSGGVIQPPATGDMATASPAMPDPEPMATAPSLPAQTANGATLNTGKTTAKVEDKAATETQAASLLQAAREAGAKGDEAGCQQHLADAKALLQKAPTQSQ